MWGYLGLLVGIFLTVSLLANLLFWIRIQQLSGDMNMMRSRTEITGDELSGLVTRLEEIKKITLR